jgi:L,D-transpeptidase YcbB
MRKDPGYLSRMHMDVLDARCSNRPAIRRLVRRSHAEFTPRQRSGTWNALGAVKIDMPNP